MSDLITIDRHDPTTSVAIIEKFLGSSLTLDELGMYSKAPAAPRPGLRA